MKFKLHQLSKICQMLHVHLRCLSNVTCTFAMYSLLYALTCVHTIAVHQSNAMYSLLYALTCVHTIAVHQSNDYV